MRINFSINCEFECLNNKLIFLFSYKILDNFFIKILLKEFGSLQIRIKRSEYWDD